MNNIEDDLKLPFFKRPHHLIRQTKIIRLQFNFITRFPLSKFQF